MPAVSPDRYRHLLWLSWRCVNMKQASRGDARWGRRAVKCHGLAACLYDDVTLHQALLPHHATAVVFICFKPVKSEIHLNSIHKFSSFFTEITQLYLGSRGDDCEEFCPLE